MSEMFDSKCLDTTSRTTIAQLASTLLEFDPECEVVISSAGLPKGVTRLCVAAPGGGRRELARYCRLVDEMLEADCGGPAKHFCNECGLTVKEWAPPLLSVSTPQVGTG